MSSTGVGSSIDRDAGWVRVADAVLGLSALGWAVRAPWEHPREPVAWALGLLNLAAGAMFLGRRQAARFCSLRDAALCVASVPLAGIAFRLAAPIDGWPRAASALFIASALAAVVAIAALGRSFGVLPAVRDTVGAGPYRIVRHPIYAAELGMVIGCCIAARHPLAWALAALTLGLVALRVTIEERVLDSSDSYRAYRERVRWRLLPGVW